MALVCNATWWNNTRAAGLLWGELHNFTVAAEAVATVSSSFICVTFFILLAAARCCSRRCLVKEQYSWLRANTSRPSPSPNRITSIAVLSLLQVAVFFMSARYNYNNYNADFAFCVVQGVMYQFVVTALIMEVVAVSVVAYNVIVKSHTFAFTNRRTECYLNAMVIGMAALFTLIPGVIQWATGEPIYGHSRFSGYCWLSMSTVCPLGFVYFYLAPLFIAHAIALGLTCRLGLRACSLYEHLRERARYTVQLFVVRRLVLLAIAAVYFLTAFVYSVVTWVGGRDDSGGFVFLSGANSFLQHCVGGLYLVPFVLPDSSYQRVLDCSNTRHRATINSDSLSVGNRMSLGVDAFVGFERGGPVGSEPWGLATHGNESGTPGFVEEGGRDSSCRGSSENSSSSAGTSAWTTASRSSRMSRASSSGTEATNISSSSLELRASLRRNLVNDGDGDGDAK